MSEPVATFNPVRDVRVAASFLTRVPVGWISDLKSDDLSRAAWAFPVIGAVLGAIGGAALYGGSIIDLHPLGCALLGIGVVTLLSGALHEDGLADVADGLGASDRNRRLEIMRDSRIGSYGVLALIFSVGIRATALASVTRPEIAWFAMIAAAAFSRGVLPPVMAWIPAARPDGLSRGAGTPTVLVAVQAAALGLITLFASLPPMAATVALVVAGLATICVALWARRMLGGQTGDVLGAIQQLTEIAVLIGAAGWSVSYL